MVDQNKEMTKDEIMQLSGRDLDAAVMMARNIFYDGNIPRYSTDMGAAWGLVECLRQRGFKHFWLTSGAFGGSSWQFGCADVYRDGILPNDKVFVADSDTAPEAISRAFLLAHIGK